jgi:acyl-CoA carboxylase epsilon subunit
MTDSTPDTMTVYGPGPRITVSGGRPDAHEIAALTAVLTALSRPAEPDGGPRPAIRTPWSSPARRMREPLARGGSGSWRASGLPR